VWLKATEWENSDMEDVADLCLRGLGLAPSYWDILSALADTHVFFVGGPSPGGGAPWHLRNVLSDSVESSDDEFFDARGK
jgi:hypothetical protein